MFCIEDVIFNVNETSLFRKTKQMIDIHLLKYCPSNNIKIALYYLIIFIIRCSLPNITFYSSAPILIKYVKWRL